MENYLQVLEESLYKKLDVLGRIEKLCARQEQILNADPVVEDEFDDSIDKKGALIDELTKLDEGFEVLYGHIKGQLEEGKEKYKSQIAALQKKIQEVTEKSIAIRAQESRNKKLAENYFMKAREDLKKGRRSSEAALNYYRSMNQSQMVSPQFMDKKK